MGIGGNFRRWIGGIIDQNILRQDDDIHGAAERLGIEHAVVAEILEEVQRSQITRRVV